MNPFDELVRSALTSDAEQAPVSTEEARRRVIVEAGREARARRRRGFAVAGAALAATCVVAGSITALAARDGIGRADFDTPAATPAPQTPDREASRLAVLRYRGVEVTVPEAMLTPENRQCGTSLQDAAWIGHPEGTTLTCAFRIGHPEELIEVQLAPTGVSIIRDQPVGEGTSTIKDGRTQVTRLVKEREVQLTVIAPDRARAEAIAGTLSVVRSPASAEGCAWHAPSVAPEATDTAAPIAPAAPDGGRICSYVDGLLEGAAVLDRSAARALARQFRAAPRRLVTRGCLPPESPPVEVTSSFVLVTLERGGHPTRLWIYEGIPGEQCQGAAGVNDRGRTVELVQDLAEALVTAASDDPQDGVPLLRVAGFG